MKIPGSIYKENYTYFALYNYWHDIYRKAPPSLINQSDHIAHVSYAFEGKSRGIDVFACRLSEDLSNEIDIKRIISRNGSKIDSAEIDIKHNIQAEIKQEYLPVLDLVRKDIEDFTREPAKKFGENRINIVAAVIPKTRIRKVSSNQYLRSGKQDFIPSCSLEANLDFSLGCISGFIPGENATFDKDFFINYFLDPLAECSYCYSIFKHQSFSKYLLDIDKAQLKEELMHGNFIGADGIIRNRKVNVLRLGKNTEAGSKFTLDSLILTLETCLETKTRVVMPTKYLEFNKEIAELLRKTNSVVLYSITNLNELEQGACIHGCDNEFRIEQAKLYRENKVNSNIYLHVDLPHEPAEQMYNTLEFAKKNNIPIQLLSWRIPSKKIAEKITRNSWTELICNGQSLLGFHKLKNQGGYYNNAGTLIACKIHPFYENLISNNQSPVKLCHHNKNVTYCGNCFLCNKGFVIPTKHVKIDYANKQRKGNWKRRRKKEKIYPSLFPE